MKATSPATHALATQMMVRVVSNVSTGRMGVTFPFPGGHADVAEGLGAAWPVSIVSLEKMQK